MKVIFKGNKEPCIQYEVKDSTEVMDYYEALNKFSVCI